MNHKYELTMKNYNNIEPIAIDEDISDPNNELLHFTVEEPTLDLENYANNYIGAARLQRLNFICDHCPSLRIECLKLAIACVKETLNVQMYQRLHSLLTATLSNNNLPDIAASSSSMIISTSNQNNTISSNNFEQNDLLKLDTNWIEKSSKKAAIILEKLDQDLKSSKSNSIKESIRRGHDELGDHYLNCGDLASAFKCYSRARDHCSSTHHIINSCFNVIRISIYLQNWPNVLMYATKIENASDFADNNETSSTMTRDANVLAITTRLRCAIGLAELAQKNYEKAAKSFLQAHFDFCDFPEMISASNVALYAGLCALATFDRDEFQKRVINGIQFKQFLELEPQLRDALFKFYESKYEVCLKILTDNRDYFLLDMYLARHLDILYKKIRNRALIQYFSPYLSADLNIMAVAFNRTVEQLEDEIMELILSGQIQARIDSHQKILYAKDANHRNLIFENVLKTSKEFHRQTQLLLLRISMHKNQLFIKKNPRELEGLLNDTCNNIIDSRPDTN